MTRFKPSTELTTFITPNRYAMCHRRGLKMYLFFLEILCYSLLLHRSWSTMLEITLIYKCPHQPPYTAYEERTDTKTRFALSTKLNKIYERKNKQKRVGELIYIASRDPHLFGFCKKKNMWRGVSRGISVIKICEAVFVIFHDIHTHTHIQG